MKDDTLALKPREMQKLTFADLGGDYYRLGVVGDGSCFFHSLCAALNYKKYNCMTEKEQRAMIQGFRCGFSVEFKNDKDEFCSISHWADKNLIEKVSKYLNINILFVNLENDKPYCGVHGKETIEGIQQKNEFSQPTIVIMWVNKNTHFEPLITLENDEIKGLFDPKNPKDIQFIKEIVKFYLNNC